MPAPHEISISGSCFQTTTKLKSNAKGRANANKMTRKQDQKPNRKTSVPRNDVNHPRVLQSQHTCIQIIVTEVPHKLHTLCTRLLTQNHNVGTCRAARVARRRATRRSKKPPQPNHAAPHPRLVLQDPRAPPRGRKNHLQHAEIKRPASRVLLRGLREKMPPPPPATWNAGGPFHFQAGSPCTTRCATARSSRVPKCHTGPSEEPSVSPRIWMHGVARITPQQGLTATQAPSGPKFYEGSRRHRHYTSMSRCESRMMPRPLPTHRQQTASTTKGRKHKQPKQRTPRHAHCMKTSRGSYKSIGNATGCTMPCLQISLATMLISRQSPAAQSTLPPLKHANNTINALYAREVATETVHIVETCVRRRPCEPSDGQAKLRIANINLATCPHTIHVQGLISPVLRRNNYLGRCN